MTTYHLSSSTKGILPVANEPQRRKAIIPWQQEFEQIEQKWIEWYRANGTQYNTIEGAWYAFKAQLLENSSSSEVGVWFEDQA
jgi:hypothetical protein